MSFLQVGASNNEEFRRTLGFNGGSESVKAAVIGIKKRRRLSNVN